MRNAENEVLIPNERHPRNPPESNSLVGEGRHMEEEHPLILEQSRVQQSERNPENDIENQLEVNQPNFINPNRSVSIKARQIKEFFHNFIPSFINVFLVNISCLCYLLFLMKKYAI
jgi:hypothetical protein